jgi:hypothetical protein
MASRFAGGEYLGSTDTTTLSAAFANDAGRKNRVWTKLKLVILSGAKDLLFAGRKHPLRSLHITDLGQNTDDALLLRPLRRRQILRKAPQRNFARLRRGLLGLVGCVLDDSSLQ